MSPTDIRPPTRNEEPPGCFKGSLAILFLTTYMLVGTVIVCSFWYFVANLFGQLTEGVPLLALRWQEVLPSLDLLLKLAAVGAALGLFGGAWGIIALWVRYLFRGDR